MFNNEHHMQRKKTKTDILVNVIQHNLAKQRQGTQRLSPDTRPWYLLIGTAAGKTSSLLHSNFEPIAPNNQAINNLTKTEDIDAWQDDEKIIFECTSNLFQSHSRHIHNMMSELPQAIQKLHRKNFDGLIIMLKADDFTDQQHNFSHICQTITNICAGFGRGPKRLPVHIIINQCNSIPGFSSTFPNHAAMNSLLQIPVNTSRLVVEKSGIEVFNFNKTMQDFCTTKISESTDQHATEQIILARAHIEEMTNKLLELIAAINWRDKLTLCNINLCSTISNAIIRHDLSEAVNDIPEYNSLSQHPDTYKPVFLQNCYNELNTVSAKVTRRYFILKYKPIVTALGIAIITLACVLPIQNYFSQQKQLISQVNNSINIANTRDLAQVVLQLQTAQYDVIKHYGVNFSKHRAYTIINNRLNSLLRNQFKRQLLATSSQRLAQQTSSNAMGLYNTLKVYLMLYKQGPVDSALIERWFKADWADTQSWSAAEQTAMLRALDITLHNGLNNSNPANIGLIDGARTALHKLTIPTLAYNILTSVVTQGGLDLRTAVPKTDTIQLQTYKVNAIYTVENANKMLTQIIPNIMLLINQNDWVIKENIGSKISKKSIKSFTAQIKNLYLNDYAQQWLQVLNGIKLQPATNLNQANSLINQLTLPSSHLWDVINIVLYNTYTPNQDSDFYKVVTNTFANISALNPSEANKTNLQTQLSALNKYISSITDSHNPQQAAFNAAAEANNTTESNPINNLQHLISQQPSVIAEWLHAVSDQAWQAILNDTATYIQTTWQDNVYNYWQSKLSGHFPLDKNSSQNISTKDFDAFFAPSGIMTNFINNYANPFINTAGKTWQWKRIHGITLPLNPKILASLRSAGQIQKIFYSENISTADATANISISRNLYKNKNIVWKNNSATTNLSKQGSNKVVINVPSQDNQTIILQDTKAGTADVIAQADGPWSLLHMLANAKIIRKSSNAYIAELPAGNRNIKLTIHFAQSNNPLASDILQKFTLLAALKT